MTSLTKPSSFSLRIVIGILTYNTPHRKTQDLVTQLLLHGYNDLHLVILPWVARKNHVPVYKHRPSSCAQVSVEDMCANLGLTYSHSPVDDLEQAFKELSCKHIIIAGAGLLPGGFARNFDVDRKSTRLNSSHITISYAVFCLKKKQTKKKKKPHCRAMK